MTIDFGDGSRSSLGAISASTPVQHIYTEEGTYRASATATDASGFTETVATFVTIQPQQPPSVIIQAAAGEPGPGSDGHLYGERLGCDLDDSALRVDVRGRQSGDGGDDGQPSRRRRSRDRGTKVITVRVVQSSGPAGDGTTVINVQSGGSRGSEEVESASRRTHDKPSALSGRWALSF